MSSPHLRLTRLSLYLTVFFGTSGVGVAAEEVTPIPARLKFGSVSLYTENDRFFAGTDRYYTNGFKLSFLTAPIDSFTAAPVPAPIRAAARALGRFLPPDRDYKLGLSLGQNIYTPVDIHNTAFLPTDRPYAAWLYFGTAFQVYTPSVEEMGFADFLHSAGRLDTFEVTLGMVGPAALGREIQNGFHDLIGVDHAKGWHHQIHDEPGLNLVFERKYRMATTNARTGLGADLIPHVGFSLGNVFTYANTGFEVRAGYRLPADFGTNLIRPSGDSNAAQRPPFSAFLFGAVDGRAMFRDITLDGNTFRDSPNLDKKTWVADLTGGLGLGTAHWQVTYTQALRTKEYEGQPKNAVFGSISLTYFY